MDIGNLDMDYTINEAAELLGVSTKTLRRWEAAGKISPGRSDGGHRRFTEFVIRELQADWRKNGVKAPAGNQTIPIDDAQYHRAAGKTAPEQGDLQPDYGSPAYLQASKNRAFKYGYPQPTDEQLAFRRKVLAR